MKNYHLSIKNCLMDEVAFKDAIKSIKSFKDVQNYLLNDCALTKKQKRCVIEKLIKFSKNYDEIWDVKRCADEMLYDLTLKQNKQIIEKLVCASSSSKDLERVKEYARSKGLFRDYLKAEIGKKIAEILDFWLLVFLKVLPLLGKYFFDIGDI